MAKILFDDDDNGCCWCHSAHNLGQFVAESGCPCDNSFLQAIKFWKIEYVRDSDEKSLAFVGHVTAGIGATAFWAPLSIAFCHTHCALQLLYKCQSCGHKVHGICQLTDTGGGQKRTAFGHYTDTTKQAEVLGGFNTTGIPFVAIEQAFDAMWTNRSWVLNIQKRWTKELIRRLSGYREKKEEEDEMI